MEAADKNSFTSGSTTWYDLSPNGNNGTLSGSASAVTNGLIGTVSGSLQVMAFNGTSDYITMGENKIVYLYGVQKENKRRSNKEYN